MGIYFLLMSDSLSIGLAAERHKFNTMQGMGTPSRSSPFPYAQLGAELTACQLGGLVDSRETP